MKNETESKESDEMNGQTPISKTKRLELLQLDISSSSIRLAWTLINDNPINDSNSSLMVENTTRKQQETAILIKTNETLRPISESLKRTDDNSALALEIQDEEDDKYQEQKVSKERHSVNLSQGIKGKLGPSDQGKHRNGPRQSGQETNLTRQETRTVMSPNESNQLAINATNQLDSNTESLRIANQRLRVTSTSRWLVRLRRFGLSQSDALRLVLNHHDNLTDHNTLGLNRTNPIRFISFKNLEPMSGYELCIEPEESNSDQEILDRYNIFDSNQWSRCLAIDTKCKELYTLANNSTENYVSYGNLDSERPSQHEDQGDNRKRDITGGALDQAHLRRPKSLVGSQNGQVSRIEQLELDDPPLNLTSLESKDSGWTNYEMVASRPGLIDQARDRSDISAGLLPIPITNFSTPTNRRPLSMGWSIPPAVGYLLAVICILALINLLLNSATSVRRLLGQPRDLSSKRKQTRKGRLSSNKSNVGHAIDIHPGELNCQSLSSDSNSSMSFIGGSENSSKLMHPSEDKSNIRPSHRLRQFNGVKSRTREMRSEAKGQFRGQDQTDCISGAKSRATRQFLSLVSDARFPLGPSFDGDSRHNADMVGLARKNYNHFISRVYNSGDSSIGYQIEDTPYINGIDAHALNMSEGTLVHSKGEKHRSNHHRHHNRICQRCLVTSHCCSNTKQSQPSPSSSSSSESNSQLEAEADKSRGKPLRVRYDKINPLYRMSPPCKHRATRRSNPNLLTSFVSSPSMDDIENPNMTTSKGYSSGGTANRGGHECESLCMIDVDGVFDCCLDRQQQRFQQQQRQLERKPGLNGALVTQPIIKPIEVNEGVQFDRDDESELVSIPVIETGSDLPVAPPPPPPPPLLESPPAKALALVSPTIESNKDERSNKENDQKKLRDKGPQAMDSSSDTIEQTKDFQRLRLELQSKLQFRNQPTRPQ